MKKFILLAVTIVGSVLSLKAQKAGYEPPKGIPRNIIIIFANGMGMNQISAETLKNGNTPAFFKYPVSGYIQAWQPNGKMPNDSTDMWAMATNKSAAGKNRKMKYSDLVKYTNIFNLAIAQKMKTALITTESITSPSSKILALDNTNNKSHEALALEYLKTKINIIIGGGSKYFEQRSDKQNLFKLFKNQGFNVEYSVRKVDETMTKQTIALVAKDEITRASDRKDFLTKSITGTMRSLNSLDGSLIVVNDTKIEEADTLNNVSLLTEEIEDLSKVADLLDREAGGETLILIIGTSEIGGLNIKNPTVAKRTWPEVSWQGKGPTATLGPLFAKGPGSEKFVGISSLEDIYSKLEGMLSSTRR